MLWQRVATAVVLLLLLLPALFSEAHAPLYAVALVFIAAGAWEWSRLNGYPGLPALLSGAACAIACALAWWAGWPEQRLPGLWAGAALLWLAGGAWLLRAGAASWRSRARPMRLAAGLLVLLLAWLAVAQARAVGIHFLLSVLVLVWAADICAYFTGRAWGGRWFKRRLAPTISPGKSWEGVAGAVIGVVALAWAWAELETGWPRQSPSLYTRLFEAGPWLWLPALLWLTAMSVVGDLVESLVKRAAAVKDSSQLLPGHGGVLDRLDALLPTLPLAMFLYGLFEQSP